MDPILLMGLGQAAGSLLGSIFGGGSNSNQPQRPTAQGYVSPYMSRANDAYYRFIGSMLGGLSKLGWGMPKEMRGMFGDVFNWFGMPGLGTGFGGGPIGGGYGGVPHPNITPMPYQRPIIPYQKPEYGAGVPRIRPTRSY